VTAKQTFGIWITGIPSSGKSTITRELVTLLQERGIHPAVLESDSLRKVLTPEPTYRPAERDRFYQQMADLGALIVRWGVPVIFDATANRRRYRDRARLSIPCFLEILIACPLEECRKRDPKGIYAAAASGTASNVPGIQTDYEPPLAPEITLDGRMSARDNARKIIEKLRERDYI
jgi:adenylylsulfate kinase